MAFASKATMAMQHDEDPAKAIFKQVGDLKDFTIYGNQILLGVYERPEKTKAGVFLSDTTRKEDQFQGKAALVLKMGPSAFVSDDQYNFREQTVKPGDWVAVFVSDGRKLVVRGTLCRLVEDHHIRLRIPQPDVIY